MDAVTTSKAKQILSAELQRLGRTYRLTARTISFEDLARAEMVFVTVHAWDGPPEMAAHLKKLASLSGFRVTFAN